MMCLTLEPTVVYLTTMHAGNFRSIVIIDFWDSDFVLGALTVMLLTGCCRAGHFGSILSCDVSGQAWVGPGSLFLGFGVHFGQSGRHAGDQLLPCRVFRMRAFWPSVVLSHFCSNIFVRFILGTILYFIYILFCRG